MDALVQAKKVPTIPLDARSLPCIVDTQDKSSHIALPHISHLRHPFLLLRRKTHSCIQDPHTGAFSLSESKEPNPGFWVSIISGGRKVEPYWIVSLRCKKKVEDQRASSIPAFSLYCYKKRKT